MTPGARPPPAPWDEGELRLLGAVRIAWAAAWLAFLEFFGQALWAYDSVPPAFWDPVSAALLLPRIPTHGAVQALWLANVAATALLLAGWRTRVAGPAVLALGTMLGSLVYSFGKIDPTSNLMLLTLLAFAFSPWGARLSLDARAGRRAPAPSRWRRWPWHLATLAIVLPYASSGLLKALRWGPWSVHAMGEFLPWWDFLQERGVLHVPAAGSAALAWLAQHPALMAALGVATPLVEMSFVLAALSERFRLAMLGALAAFQSTLSLLTGISLQGTHVAITLVAVPTLLLWLRGRAAPHGRLARLLPTTPVPATPLPRAAGPLGAAAGAVAAFALCLAPLGSMPIPSDLVPGIALGNGLWATPAQSALFLAAGLALFAWAGFGLARDGWARLRAPLPGEAVLLYDQDCGFCQRWVRWALRRGAGHSVRFAPCQSSPDVRERAGLPLASCMEEAALVEGASSRGGAGAISGVLERLPGWRNAHWRLAGAAWRLDPVRLAEGAGYRWVARNRHRLAPGECELPPPT